MEDLDKKEGAAASETKTVQIENKMGTMPLGKLLIQISLPMMISMLVQALYNIVDSIFVAQISENALTAVSLAFPIQNLMISTSVGTGVGVNALLSMRLGQQDKKAVSDSAMNGIFLYAITCVVFIVLGIFVPRIYFESQTNNPEIIEYGVQYLSICMIVSVGLYGAILFERLLQSTGRTVLSMISQLAGAITNIIFDPLLIFGLLGFPKLGIAGAAWATVLGQIVGFVISLSLNLTKNKEISFKIKGFRPHGKVIADIYKVGVPSILLGSIGSVLTYLINLILGAFTMTAVAVYGVYFKLQSFIFMPVFGLNNGIVPIVAYNYGAKRKDRIMRGIKLCAIAAVLIMGAGLLIFELFPRQLLAMFNASEEMYAIGIPALRRIALHFPVAAICITLISVFQALGKGLMSMIVSFVRQIIVLLPAAYLLSLTGDVNNIWWAFIIAEGASVIASAIGMRITYNKDIKTL
ncbi:MATE family efflux transporter [Treponema bryantii]|uniref:MATE family efflux transporter n=1 Tax=Treponema bryantii TaxID=163 RepID=UPI002B315B32|nr:MATE family efflux transporter [Treponema bryantii]